MEYRLITQNCGAAKLAQRTSGVLLTSSRSLLCVFRGFRGTMAMCLCRCLVRRRFRPHPHPLGKYLPPTGLMNLPFLPKTSHTGGLSWSWRMRKPENRLFLISQPRSA